MKILHILYSGLGGTGNVFYSFIEADEEKKYTYEALFVGVEPIREEYIQKSNFFKINWSYIKKKKGLDISFNKQFISTIRKSDASIIFLHGSRWSILSKMAVFFNKNKKNIIVIETQANNLKSKMDWIGLTFALLFCKHIVFLTNEFNIDIKKKLKWIYNKNKISVINNGINLNLFKPAETVSSSPKILGMQSRIIPIKDHITLLQAFALLKKQNPQHRLQLKIAGDGESLQSLQVLSKELGFQNEVEFTGMLNEKELVSFLQSLDIYIHASLGETMSTAIMQAMACKIPIIASNVPGINNMISNNDTGILVPVKNVFALAEAINIYLSKPTIASDIKERAYQFAKLHYSNKLMFKKYSALFEAIDND